VKSALPGPYEEKCSPLEDLVEHVVAVPGRELLLLAPRDGESLLSEEAFEREEFLPYWAELWPSSLALARTIAARTLRGARTLELGCGLALPSMAAVLAGGRVLATDWSSQATALARENAARNGIELETLTSAWAEPEPLVERGPWDLVLGADLLYERRNAQALLELLPLLAGPATEVIIADPGRSPAGGFLERAADRWAVASARARELPQGAIHTLRLRAPRPREARAS
jgi:predicted nicotinamide N-methyase